jgi:hypothetical protein
LLVLGGVVIVVQYKESVVRPSEAFRNACECLKLLDDGGAGVVDALGFNPD